jgi:hypothetical protein
LAPEKVYLVYSYKFTLETRNYTSVLKTFETGADTPASQAADTQVEDQAIDSDADFFSQLSKPNTKAASQFIAEYFVKYGTSSDPFRPWARSQTRCESETKASLQGILVMILLPSICEGVTRVCPVQ